MRHHVGRVVAFNLLVWQRGPVLDLYLDLEVEELVYKHLGFGLSLEVDVSGHILDLHVFGDRHIGRASVDHTRECKLNPSLDGRHRPDEVGEFDVDCVRLLQGNHCHFAIVVSVLIGDGLVLPLFGDKTESLSEEFARNEGSVVHGLVVVGSKSGLNSKAYRHFITVEGHSQGSRVRKQLVEGNVLAILFVELHSGDVLKGEDRGSLAENVLIQVSHQKLEFALGNSLGGEDEHQIESSNSVAIGKRHIVSNSRKLQPEPLELVGEIVV